MIGMDKRIIATGGAVAMLLGLTGVTATAPAAAAKKYTACVKKSSGEVRLLLGKSKKCKKGWKKTTWTKAGPKGAKGADGTPGEASSFGYVVDANGTVVVRSLGAFIYPFAILSVRIDGGTYIYYPNGWLIPSGPVYWDNASCTGTPFTTADDTMTRDSLVGNAALRVVIRSGSPSALGPARAFKIAGAATSVNGLARWRLNESGVCVADSNFTGYRIPVSEVTAPPDYAGPLRLV